MYMEKQYLSWHMWSCLLFGLLLVRSSFANPPSSSGSILLSDGEQSRTRTDLVPSAEFIYISKLYDKMAKLDKDTPHPPSSDSTKTETIVGIYPNEPNGDGYWLTFNIRQIHFNDNITLAQVVMMTEDGRPCSFHALVSINGRRFLCWSEPFGIEHLVAFDVTSDLLSSLRVGEISFYNRHPLAVKVGSPLLVLFKDVDVNKLFSLDGLGQDKSQECDATQSFGPAQETRHSPLHTSCPRETHREKAIVMNDPPNRHLSETILSDNEGHFDTRDESSFDGTTSTVDSDEKGESTGDDRSLTSTTGEVGERRFSFHDNKRNDDENIDDHRARYWRYVTALHVLRSHGSWPHAVNTPSRIERLRQLLDKRNSRTAEASGGNGSNSYRRPTSVCQIRPLVLSAKYDFNWMDIIAPVQFQVNMCSGDCPLVVHPSEYSSYYIYLVSLYASFHPQEARHRQPPVPRPSCMPKSFEDISVLRLVNESSVIMERWNNAKVVQCWCA